MNAKAQGYTLVELSFVILIMGIIAASTVPFVLEEWRQKKTDVTASEVWAIGSAAQKYSSDFNGWPDQANSCAGALNELITQGYIGSIDGFSPWYDATDNPSGAYTTTCNTSTFSVTVSTTTDWAGYIANNLAVTDATGASTTTVFPIASSVPALAGMLHRDYDAAHPEQNRMNTTLQMGDGTTTANRITNALDVVLAPAAVGGKGRSLAQAVQDVTVAQNNELIQKPTCPAGQTPQIFTAPQVAVGGNPANPIGGFATKAISANASQWRVYLEVLTKDGWISNSAQTFGRIIVMTKCT